MPHILWTSLNKSDFILCHLARGMFRPEFQVFYDVTSFRHGVPTMQAPQIPLPCRPLNACVLLTYTTSTRTQNLEAKVKLSLYTPWTHTGGEVVLLHPFFIWVLEGSGQLHSPAGLPTGWKSSTHGIRSWVGPIASLDGFGEDTISCFYGDSKRSR